MIWALLFEKKIIYGQNVIQNSRPSQKRCHCDGNSTNYHTGLCALTLEHLSESELRILENPGNALMAVMNNNIYWFIGIGLVTWFCGWIQTTCLMISGQR